MLLRGIDSLLRMLAFEQHRWKMTSDQKNFYSMDRNVKKLFRSMSPPINRESTSCVASLRLLNRWGILQELSVLRPRSEIVTSFANGGVLH
jgi:hypothetical protein